MEVYCSLLQLGLRIESSLLGIIQVNMELSGLDQDLACLAHVKIQCRCNCPKFIAATCTYCIAMILVSLFGPCQLCQNNFKFNRQPKASSIMLVYIDAISRF